MTRTEDFFKYVGQTSDHSLAFDLKGAEGSYFFDQEDNKFLDFHSGVGVMNLGHNNSVVNGMIREQLKKYSHTIVYGEHVQDSQVSYAKALSLKFNELNQEDTFSPESDKQVFFANTGNEAVDLAIKLVRKVTGKKGLVALEKGFHGRGYGAMQVTWNPEYKKGFFVDDEETDWIDPFAEDVEAELDKVNWATKAAIIVEYVQGEAGARALPLEFLQALRKRTKEEGVFLVADEVQTGFGRTGEVFAQETFGVTADVTCLGKAGGGGLPFGAVVAEKELFEILEQPALSHISTFAGNPVVCAGGIGVLVQLTPSLLEKSKEASKLLREGIEGLAEKYPEVVKGYTGVGMMLGLHLVEGVDTGKFYELAKKNGVIMHFKLNAGSTLRVSPPINLTNSQVEEGLEALEKACKEIG